MAARKRAAGPPVFPLSTEKSDEDAARLAKVLEFYYEHASGRPPSAEEDDAEHVMFALSDLLCDIRQYCLVRRLNFDRAVQLSGEVLLEVLKADWQAGESPGGP